jgi:menaquinone-dependent protoporphyrinogen oxidase
MPLALFGLMQEETRKRMNCGQIAIVYTSKWGQTLKIATHIAARLRSSGYAVELYQADHPPSREALRRLDGIITGSWVRGGRHMHALRRFVRCNLDALLRVPSAFFSVSLLQLSKQEASRMHAAEYVPRFLNETGWRPRLSTEFAGALRFTRFGWLGKRIMRAIWRREGFEADLSRDYEFTDWDKVDIFADQFSSLLASEAQPRQV